MVFHPKTSVIASTSSSFRTFYFFCWIVQVTTSVNAVATTLTETNVELNEPGHHVRWLDTILGEFEEIDSVCTAGVCVASVQEFKSDIEKEVVAPAATATDGDLGDKEESQQQHGEQQQEEQQQQPKSKSIILRFAGFLVLFLISIDTLFKAGGLLVRYMRGKVVLLTNRKEDDRKEEEGEEETIITETSYRQGAMNIRLDEDLNLPSMPNMSFKSLPDGQFICIINQG